MKSIFFELLDIALEEDITAQAETATPDAIGSGATGSTRRNPAGFDGERDMNKTDDIFGLNDSKEDTSEEEENSDVDENEADAEEGEDDMDIENDESDGDGGELSDEGSEDQPPDQDDDTAKIYKKNRLRDNAIHFFNILDNDINEISNSISSINDQSLISTCNRAITNLRGAKDALFQLISEDLSGQTYAELLKKYVSLRQVYDISTDMLIKHFEESHRTLELKGKRKKKTSKK